MYDLRYNVKENSKVVELENYASVVQTGQAKDLSSRYSFIPTTQVLDVLKAEGWMTANVRESRTLRDETRGFQKHAIRLRNPGIKIENTKDILFPEIILTNSHNGLASFQIMAGIFRQICSNGLCVADSMFQVHRIRHMGYTNDKVLEAVYSVIKSLPAITGKVGEFQNIQLNAEEKQVFAESILGVVFDAETWEKGKTPDTTPDRHNTASMLMLPRRSEDREDNLWNVYNRAQEKIIKQGVTVISENPRYRVGNKTREVKAIDRDIKLNKALWALTERMAELKK